MPATKPSLLKHTNNHLNQLKENEILSFNAKVSQIPDVIKLTLGEPDFNVPEHVKQAAIDSINGDDSHYSPVPGSKTFRETVSKFLGKHYQVDYDPNTEITATVGVTEGLYATLGAGR